MTEQEHRELGVLYFNKAWDYIDTPRRSAADNLSMIHYAHASRLHWELSGAPMLNIVRGEWQLARVYAILKMGEASLLHAQYCLDKTIEHKIGDFDLVFGHEGVARAHHILGNKDKAEHHLKLALRAIDHVAEPGDREYCKNELKELKNDIG